MQAPRLDVPSSPSPLDPAAGPARLLVRPWPDPVIDRVGYDPRSAYVERFWLGAIGPSCTLLLRQWAQRFEREPEGFPLDVAACARSLGLGGGLGRNAPLGRTISRCCQFGLAQRFGHDGVVVRRRLPPVARHLLARLPDALQEEHATWLAAQPAAGQPVVGPPLAGQPQAAQAGTDAA